jgi:NADH-quinone oxidoreductase subunit H
MDALGILIVLVKSVVVLAILMTGFAYMTLFERKVAGRIQVRFGPNRVGPFGLLQPLADGIKLMLKEDIRPLGADKFVYALAPMISLIVAISAFAVIPIGPQINVFGREIPLVIADVNIGILYVFAVASLGVYGIVLAGWSSNNKYSLLGGIRSSAQMISYELALGISVIGVIMLAGSLSLYDIVNAQRGLWFIALQPLGFIVFVIAGIAETNRAPFDLPEAEQELVAGYHTEYGGMKFAMFFAAEYISMITISAIATTLFLGGYLGPIVDGPHWFFLKVMAFLFLYVWLRATLPRFRYDRLMQFGWQILLPLSLLNVLITAVGIIVFG